MALYERLQGLHRNPHGLTVLKSLQFSCMNQFINLVLAALII